MPRKIRASKRASSTKPTRGQIALWVLSAIVALSMVFGYIVSALGR